MAVDVVCGIDPSLTGTACVALGKGGEVKRVFQLTTPASRIEGAARIELIRDQVLNFLVREQVGFVAIEGFAYGARGRSVHEVAGVGWVLRMMLWDAMLRTIQVPPTLLKSYITGKGNAKKELMIREVYRRWQYEAQTNDDCDAYALGRFALEYVAHMDSNDKTTKRFAKLAGKITVL